ITILGFGSLLSEASARGSFPELRNFREVTVRGYRRTFQHPAFVFFERGIADPSTKRFSSLSAHHDETALGSSFIAVAFEIEPFSKAEWLRREEEFTFHVCEYEGQSGAGGVGIMCCSAPSDQVYVNRWGSEKYKEKLVQYDLPGIWGLDMNKDIKPCSVYLRHCVLAAQRRSAECYASFLDQTFLADMTTTIRVYLEENPWVMETMPPESLAGRYCG
ncbi:unnamed protein product, partial [Ectocarpus fasciculatus]